MRENSQQQSSTTARRQTFTVPSSSTNEDDRFSRRLSASTSIQTPTSPVSPVSFRLAEEYRSQQRVPPAGADFQRHRLLSRAEDTDEVVPQRRLSVISEAFYPIEDDGDRTRDTIDIVGARRESDQRRRILFILEPIIVGVILLPIIALSWECGWNLVWILLNVINGYPSQSQEETHFYSWQSLLIPYFIVQILLLVFYLGQDVFYEFLKRQKSILRYLLLKCHIFLLISVYIVQWEVLWTMWDQYMPRDWYFELALSLTSLFSLIVFIGHLSDLVCAPFLASYDSIEYCLHFGCPLLTRQMKQWKINLINYFLYEVIISNISIMAWRGFYNFLDQFLYPGDSEKSALICLLIGYLLYFPLMYFQNYLEYLNLKYEFWVFVSINFPQLYRNIRHLFAFLSCIFLWRGLWSLYDTYVIIFELHYQTYSLLYLLCFLFLALLQTSSSINGPLSNMEDNNQFFPLYPHCYVSIVARKLF